MVEGTHAYPHNAYVRAQKPGQHNIDSEAMVTERVPQGFREGGRWLWAMVVRKACGDRRNLTEIQISAAQVGRPLQARKQQEQRQGGGNEKVCAGDGSRWGKMATGGGVDKATRIEGEVPKG